MQHPEAQSFVMKNHFTFILLQTCLYSKKFWGVYTYVQKLTIVITMKPSLLSHHIVTHLKQH